MKAFLLAAGYGTRLKPITDTMPNMKKIDFSITKHGSRVIFFWRGEMMNLYFKQYCKELIDTINDLTSKDLNIILHILWDAYKENKKIYIIGNGGNGATAEINL